ncbi:hypothetical protein DFJ58DRAFT_914695 [Suillus subalutaceus]|uniref:uncharacterized protein n=1 Tax=Suillus subalutaceus TaxID=48586 RepID=UPI001B87D7A9|nr:uncharacterized protein DFJ58DRAFT_914695 [Suillus subalutaceus]KAG1850338.1 hypothetical protein DFJ58DRAFT_914695 [Suillus subalutaceus]
MLNYLFKFLQRSPSYRRINYHSTSARFRSNLKLKLNMQMHDATVTHETGIDKDVWLFRMHATHGCTQVTFKTDKWKNELPEQIEIVHETERPESHPTKAPTITSPWHLAVMKGFLSLVLVSIALLQTTAAVPTASARRSIVIARTPEIETKDLEGRSFIRYAGAVYPDLDDSEAKVMEALIIKTVIGPITTKFEEVFIYVHCTALVCGEYILEVPNTSIRKNFPC